MMREKGLTLIEILMVSVIVGMLLLVVLPRAWRARIDAKYSIVRQSAKELAHWGMEWAERNLESQKVSDTCVLDDYVGTLVGYTGEQNNANNWTGALKTTPDSKPPESSCRNDINNTVSNIMPPEKQPMNPFNGLSYFNERNDDGEIFSGLLCLCSQLDSNSYNNYYFVYTGIDSNAVDDWHGGMGNGASPLLANLRNGIFMARLMP